MPKAARTQALLSVRDLTADHLPMLKSILSEGYKAIHEKFAIPMHKVYAYFHYLPTYWLLHIHFVHVDKASRDAREQIPLEVVINNLEMNGKYY
jgi:m7GpppX diphosphatase